MSSLHRPSRRDNNKFDVELTTDSESEAMWQPRNNDNCGNSGRSKLTMLKYTAAALICYIAGYLTCAVFTGSHFCRSLTSIDAKTDVRQASTAILNVHGEDPAPQPPTRNLERYRGCPDPDVTLEEITEGKLSGPFPWRCLPEKVQVEYTMNGRAAFIDMYLDGDKNTGQTREIWEMQQIEEYWRMARKKQDLSPAYCGASNYFLSAFARFPVKDKRTLVIGSIRPWVEALLLMSEAAEPVTTIDFNPPISRTDKIDVRNASLLKQAGPNDAVYDAIFSYSSLEHDGLGRYGDPLNPNGDLQALKKIKALLKPGGLFYLGLPVGQDILVFNAHRVYGRHRLSWLLSGWKLLGMFGRAQSLEALWNLPPGGGGIGDCGAHPNWEQPVLVLQLDDGKVSPCCGKRIPCHFCSDIQAS